MQAAMPRSNLALLPWLALVLSLLFSLVLGSAAQADDSSKALAAEHYRQGVRHLQGERYRQAVEQFKLAYQRSPHYAVLYNLGMAQAALGQAVEAVDTLERYLREGAAEVPAERREAVRAELLHQRRRIGHVSHPALPAGVSVLIDGQAVSGAQLAVGVALSQGDHEVVFSRRGETPVTRRLVVAGGKRVVLELEPAVATNSADGAAPAARTPLASGWLEIRCPLGEVAVWLADRRLGNTPLQAPLQVPAGAHRVRFERHGYVADEQAVQVEASKTVAVQCDLHAPEQQAEVALVAPDPGPERAGLASEHSGGQERLLALVAGGLGVVLAGTAVGLYAWNSGRFDEWTEAEAEIGRELRTRELGLEAARARYAQSDRDLSAIQTVDTLTVTALLGSVAALSTGVVLWVLAPESQRDGKRPLAAASNGSGLWLRGHF